MRKLIFITLLFFCSLTAVHAQQLNDFESIGGVTMNDTFQIPASHAVQVIAKAGDPLSSEGVKGTLSDFTGFVPINGSSIEGYLCINSEFLDFEAAFGPIVGAIAQNALPTLSPAEGNAQGGGVDVYHIKYSPSLGRWEVLDSRKASFGTFDSGDITTGVNCSGMVTPWETVITCEEISANTLAGLSGLLGGLLDDNGDGRSDIGWCVEIDPVTAEIMDYDNDGQSDKLWALGNLSHENISEPIGDTAVFYGEDNAIGSDNSCVFKFVADVPQDLSSGKLYTLVRDANDSTRGNWVQIPNGTKQEQEDITEAANDVGAWNVPRVEDVEIGPHDGKVYVTSTTWNEIWRFDDVGDHVENLEIYVGSKSEYPVDSAGETGKTVSWSNCDNLCFDKDGNLYVMQDGGQGYIYYIENTHTEADPKVSVFGSAAFGAEPTGMTLTPDGKYMFVSIQHPDESNSTPQSTGIGGEVVYDISTTLVVSLRDNFTVSREDALDAANALQISDPYPNPATDAIQFEVMSPKSQKATVEICNNVGYVVRSSTIQLNNGHNDLRLGLEDLTPQLYYMTLRTADGAMSKSFLKLTR